MAYTGPSPKAGGVGESVDIAEWLWCQTKGLVSLKFGVSLLKGEQLGEAIFAVAALSVFDQVTGNLNHSFWLTV
jgi:hypothetical protein